MEANISQPMCPHQEEPSPTQPFQTGTSSDKCFKSNVLK